MTKIAVSGALGRMGRRILSMVGEARDLQMHTAIEHAAHPDMGRDLGDMGMAAMPIALADAYTGGADVLVDFSSPEASMMRLTECLRHATPLVLGTTGFSQSQEKKLRDAGQVIPVLVASNMSVGVNVFFKFAVDLARVLHQEYDIEILETHHRFKKDAPSGTAVTLAKKVAKALQRDVPKDLSHGREGYLGERPRTEIGMHAVRSGDVVGEHTILFGSLGDRIELTHRAHSRDIFARGAIRAARFLAGQPPGCYGMEDVLGL